MATKFRVFIAAIAALIGLVAPISAPAAHATASAWSMTDTGRTTLVQGGFGNITTSSAATVVLVTSSSNLGASSTTCSGVTNEVANGNGYTTGGVTATLTASGTTSVTLTFSAPITWTASGGSIVARKAYVCVNSKVLALTTLDNTPADVTTTSGNTLTISNSNPVLTVA